MAFTYSTAPNHHLSGGVHAPWGPLASNNQLNMCKNQKKKKKKEISPVVHPV